MRNEAVKPEAIRASGFARAAELAQTPELLLAAPRHHQRQLPACGGGRVGADGRQAGGQTEWLFGAFGVIAGCPERTHSWPDSAAALVP